MNYFFRLKESHEAHKSHLKVILTYLKWCPDLWLCLETFSWRPLLGQLRHLKGLRFILQRFWLIILVKGRKLPMSQSITFKNDENRARQNVIRGQTGVPFIKTILNKTLIINKNNPPIKRKGLLFLYESFYQKKPGEIFKQLYTLIKNGKNDLSLCS